MNTAPALQIRILVVDDEPDVTASLSKLLGTLGYEVETASTGREAFGIMIKSKFDLVITDVQMPDMSGIELFQRIKKLKIPVIFMSGFSKELDIKKASDLGATDFLNKPFSFDDLKNSVELALHYKASDTYEQLPENLDTLYCKVHIQDFISGSKSALDVFVRISHEKYLQVARADSPLSLDRMQSYFDKGLKYLFIRKEDFARYVGFNLTLISNVNRNRTPLPPARKLALVRQASEVYMENIFVNGIDREGYDHAKVLVECALQMASECDSLFEVLEALRDHHDSAYAHSLAVAVYSSTLARHIGWTGGPASFKVSMAGLLHDIGLRELPRALSSKKKSEMNQAEVQQYETHPSRGRDLLRGLPFISEEIIQAVGQHHENNSGMGFPLGLNRGKTHPLAKILNIVGRFCHLVLDNEGGIKMTPAQALNTLFNDHEDEFEPILLRSLFEMFSVPVPEKLQNVASTLNVNAT